jgi:uncharacterized protein YjeT (DUF2065 family)
LNITVSEDKSQNGNPEKLRRKIMDIVIQSLGIVIVAVGVVYLLRPDVMKWLMGFFKQGKRIYFAGLIRLALAVIFLLGARECKYFWVIFAFGILFLIGGVLIFILGPQKLRRILDWYQKQSVLLLRVLAVIALAIGAVIIYSA